MNVSIVRPNDAAESVDLCIVIDVLRATTTAAVLCHRLGELCVVRTPADLDKLPSHAPGYALFSELKDVEVAIPRFDNSPVLARDADLAGRTPVLVTTNGTIAVGLAAERAKEVVLAAFVNMTAVVDYVRRRNVGSVAVMPAGNIGKGQLCIEDDGCAGAIAAALRESHVDVAAVIAACRADARIQRRANDPGLGADIELCLAVDEVAVVPRVSGASDRGWFGVAR